MDYDIIGVTAFAGGGACVNQAPTYKNTLGAIVSFAHNN